MAAVDRAWADGLAETSSEGPRDRLHAAVTSATAKVKVSGRARLRSEMWVTDPHERTSAPFDPYDVPICSSWEGRATIPRILAPMGAAEDLFDLTDPDVSVRECAQCHEPVAGRISPDGTVNVTCGYCGREDAVAALVRPSGEGSGESAYRGKDRGASGRKLPLTLDLSKPPPGMTGREKRDALRKAWVEAKTSPVPDDDEARATHEYRLVWLAGSLSSAALREKELVRARSVLEAALEKVEIPQYRAMLLARLARLAAQSKAVPLAQAWLARVPPKMRAPEVVTDVRVAEAFVAREEEGPRGVLDVIGHGDAASAFSGPLRLLAVALRTDAHEKLGEHQEALATWTSGAKAGSLMLGSYAALYGLAPETRKRAFRRGYVALVVLVAVLWAVVSLLRTTIAGEPMTLAPFVVVGVALVVALGMKATRR